MNHMVTHLVLGSLLLTGCGLVPPAASRPAAGDKPVASEDTDRRVEPRAASTPSKGSADTLKLEQVAVVRPKVAPGERAMLIARYSVVTAVPVDIQETRTVRYGDQVLVTRERVVKRAGGDWVSEFPLTIPSGAAEGLYSYTARIQASGSAARGADEKSTMFSVEPGSAAGKSPGASEPKPVDKPLDKNAANADIQIKVWTDKPRYRIGEAVTFHFETNRDGYVTLVNTGTSGAVTMLFPNRFAQSHAVKARTRYSVPGAQDNYALTVNGPPGIELVYALATLTPMKFIEADYSRSRTAFRSMPADVLTRDINVVMKQTPADKQSKVTLELEVTK